MKVVINRRHGGFGLSPLAIKLLIQKGSNVIKPYEKKEELRSDYNVDLGDGFYADWMDGVLDQKAGLVYHSCYVEDRAHPDLVQIVEELGEDSFGKHAELHITEVPDDVKWHIEEYDGLEWVAESHRTWD